MKIKRVLLVILVAFVVLTDSQIPRTSFTQEVSDDMPHDEVKDWAQIMGNHLFHTLNTVGKYSEIEENFNSMGATIASNDGLPLVKQMAEDVSNMMKHKIQAVKRIMNVAEEVSQDTSYLQEDSWNGYYNSKLINQGQELLEELEERYSDDEIRSRFYGDMFQQKYSKLDLTKNMHFDNIAISLNASTVHVPTNVFEGGPPVIRAIRWSEALEKTFTSNYEHDPTLSWQYFGSSTGFLRQYPGSSWQMDAQDPDLYDARLRSWYIQAANTPKDVVILLDISGSMTGLRKEIAKHVVINILDTLNENDFLNILVFNENTTTLVDCFKDTLVQANLENIGEFKRSLDNLSTTNIANLSIALTKGFQLLQKHNQVGHGAQCNQAIMLVTDGAPYTYTEIFKKYNWPQLQIRVFTYLIGREMTDKKSLKWMACTNKGYFVHVTTPSEVREQVLKYIPVVARPMVMYTDKHPIVWTGVYADIATSVSAIEHVKFSDDPEIAFFGRRVYPGSKYGYRLLTTVSVPVLNRTQKAERVADLLGVAGADVPIREIEKLIPPYKLGVNGYAFMVNKNGHILFHPDLRPTFQDILKPNYNSVDLHEVELTDFVNETVQNTSRLFNLRQDMIDQKEAIVTMRGRYHLDKMRRVEIRDHTYFTESIRDTPFSLGISLPYSYGRYKVNGQIELSLTMSENVDFNVTSYFSSGNWSLHPDWVYCEYKYDQGVERTPEELMMHFLVKAQLPGWKWRSTRSRPPPQLTQPPHTAKQYDQHDHYCDKTLVQSMLFDAKATDVYNNNNSNRKSNINEKNKGGTLQYFKETTVFVATRSGFTRWIDDIYHKPESVHFMEKNKRAIDEVWYKRAVDYYKEDENAYVYSVPPDASTRLPNEVMVTATRAIFIKQNKFQQVPAAVIGINIKLDKFIEYFTNETYKCRERGVACQHKTCGSDELDCYLLDDSGFVIASEKTENVGKFFGLIEGTIMESLVSSETYNKIYVYDYQGVCLDEVNGGNFASILMTPFNFLKWSFNWMATNFMWILIKTNLYHLWDSNEAWAYTQGNDQHIPIYYDKEKVSEYEYEEDPLPLSTPVTIYDQDKQSHHDEEIAQGTLEVKNAYIKKTRPRSCDKEVKLYKLNNSKLKDPSTGTYKPVKGKLSNCHSDGCGKPFCVQKVEKTNLVLVVVHNECKCESGRVDIEPAEITYTEDQYCNRLLKKHYRVRPGPCYNYHPDEGTIHDCSGANRFSVSSLLLTVLAFFYILKFRT